MIAEMVPSLPAHFCLHEPELLFHPDRPDDKHRHPLVGLLQHGPFSRSLVNCVIDPIRVAFIVPWGESGKMLGLLKELEARHTPRERHQYLPEFPGFSRVFGIRAVPAAQNAQVELVRQVERDLSASDVPHLTLADRLVRCLGVLDSVRQEFDVAFIYLPNRWQRSFSFVSDTEDFDLHDYLKAVSAVKGLPIQILLEDKALTYPCRCSVMWRLGLALYCKAGGVPWKLADSTPDMAFVGLSYAVRSPQNAGRRFVTCCSQVFDADGAGLEFILYETDDVRIERDNPFLSRAEMRRVMARSMALFQRRHGGRTPKQVVVQKSTEFKPDEVKGCFDAWRSAEGLDLLQVQQDTIWRGVKIDAPVDRGQIKGTASRYPCDRGTCLQIGPREVLLWTQGNAPPAVGGNNFFKEGKGIPSPILIRRFAGHGGWAEQCRHVLGLTKMNWNNDGLYDRLPVTLGYAKILARTVKRMSELVPKPYQLRYFM